MSLAREKICVTGGAGFIGRNLVALLLKEGYKVIVFDNLSKGDSHSVLKQGADFVKGDVTDIHSLIQALDDGVDAVIHLAAYGSVMESIDDPLTNFNQNAVGTLNVLEACRRCGIQRLVFSSTGGAIMGNTPPPVNEQSVPKPISPYGASKLCGEAYLSAYSASFGISTVALRFGNVYGPGSAHKKGAVTQYIHSLMKKEPLIIFGDGSASRDFLYVDDLCSGILLGLDYSRKQSGTFHLSSGIETTIHQLASAMIAVSGVDGKIEFREERRGEVHRNFADFSAAKKTLGFTPRTSLKEGLKVTWNWFLSHEKYH
jgi:UDP-glucose 4-epimerase